MKNTYRGHAQWLSLVTNNICFAPCPEAEDEVEQHLRISADGWVWVGRYAYGIDGQHVCISQALLDITTDLAERVLKTVDECFCNFSKTMILDAGRWDLAIVNQNGEEFQLCGSLANSPQCPEGALSYLMRNALDLPWLFAFDGRTGKDRVDRICIEYHRVSQTEGKPSNTEVVPFATLDYAEQLIVDRPTETLKHVQCLGSGCQVTREFYVQGGVASLLDEIEDGFFAAIQGEPEDALSDPMNENHYRMTVDYLHAPPQVFTGFYGKDSLPTGWPQLMTEIHSFMTSYGLGEILNPSVYAKARRRRGDRIFLSIRFDDYGKTYCYLTDDDSIDIGDFVLVPVGTENRPAVVEVVNIDYLPEDKAPIPFEKIKSILRKCTDNDFEYPEW